MLRVHISDIRLDGIDGIAHMSCKMPYHLSTGDIVFKFSMHSLRFFYIIVQHVPLLKCV